MRGGIRIGQLFGIEIHVDWSWLFIFLLVTWNLALGVFPKWHPDWPLGLDWSIALLAALLFFASVLLHELSHSLVATARGLPVHSITLFLFGGVSNLEHEPASPGTEFLMAIVGPLTSVVLGVVFLLLGGITAGRFTDTMSNPVESFSRLGPLPTLLLWLGPINIVVGLFNLIPGFPLDGGRIVRSLLWAATRNLKKATQWAAGVGQTIGWIFILAGIAMVFGVSVPYFGTGFVSGVWLAFIGWFLSTAARASYQQVVIQELLADVPVAKLMKSAAPVVSPDLPVSSFVHDVLFHSDERAFPVMDGDRLLGLVCLEDVRRIPHDARETAVLGQIMTPVERLVTATPEESVSEALGEISNRDVRQLPVVQSGRLVGMLRRRDILKWLQIQSGIAAG